MLHFVEHRIENNPLRASFYDLLDFFGAFGCATPDRDLGTEIGIFVALSEPVANAPLAARLVIIYCEIDSFGEMKTRRIAG